MNHRVETQMIPLHSRELVQMALRARPIFLGERAEDALREEEEIANVHATRRGERQPALAPAGKLQLVMQGSPPSDASKVGALSHRQESLVTAM